MILTPSRAVRVSAYPAPADLRKGYDGLSRLVQSGLKADPMNGDLYLFVNESRKLCKVLVWDGTGLCIIMKRLERGCFAKLWRDDGQAVRLTQSELALYIEGCTLLDRRCYRRSRSSEKQLFRIRRCDLKNSWSISIASKTSRS